MQIFIFIKVGKLFNFFFATGKNALFIGTFVHNEILFNNNPKYSSNVTSYAIV